MADGSDNKATLRAPVYRADGQPARGGRLLKANKENYQRLFDEEMQDYPENYAVYRTKWFYASGLDRSPLPVIEAVYQAWRQDKPLNPKPLIPLISSLTAPERSRS
jgi:hypothetical protein